MGEGSGDQIDLDKAFGEYINKLLLSHRNDEFFEAKLKAHRQNKAIREAEKEPLQRKKNRDYFNQDGITYTEQVIDQNLNNLRNKIESVQIKMNEKFGSIGSKSISAS